MIKNIFNKQINSITLAAFLVAVSSLVSRFLGIFRDRILASHFGASETLDLYYAAFRIPDLIFNLLILGALSAGFIPIFTCLIKEKNCQHKTLFSPTNSEAWLLVNNILNVLIITLLVIAGLGLLAAPLITKLLTPGFSPEMQEITSQLTRIMFLSPLFLGISGILGGVLQSFKRFFIYSLSPILYNIGIIIGALYIAPHYGIHGLAWGVVLGAFMHMAVQLPTATDLGFKYKPYIKLADQNLKKIFRMMIPRTMGLAISQINLVVITIIASTLEGGSLAIFNFANNLQSFPIGIFGISYAIAAFPTLATFAFDTKKLRDNFSSTIRQILFFIVPSTVLLITLRAQITRSILGSGLFDWNDTILTMEALKYFALSLFAQATIPLLARVFYARHNSKTPFYVGLVSAATNIALSLFLAPKMGINGLVLAYSIANIVNFLLLWLLLKLEIKQLDEMKILASTVKFTAAAIACGITIQGVKILVWPYIDMNTFGGIFIQGFTSGIAGLTVYAIFCALFGSEEFFNFWNIIKRRLPWKKIRTGDQGEARGI